MTDLQMDTTKDAALRLCAQMVEERDAYRKALEIIASDDGPLTLRQAQRVAEEALLARLDGRAK